MAQYSNFLSHLSTTKKKENTIFLFTFSQLADAFILSDLQTMRIDAIKTNKRAIIYQYCDQSRLA